jgi:ribonuclease HII
MKKTLSLLEYEKQARRAGYQKIAGIDEAGRGPLAGPVVIAACVLPEGLELCNIRDSKRLSQKQREYFYDLLQKNEEIVKAVVVIEPAIIDEINILQASLMGMVKAVARLIERPDYVLIDGNKAPLMDVPCETIVKGDTFSQSIMAAAILAKVTRDQIMKDYHQMWPEYGFDQHKGYPTLNHRVALQKFGACPIHRKSFMTNFF